MLETEPGVGGEGAVTVGPWTLLGQHCRTYQRLIIDLECGGDEMLTLTFVQKSRPPPPLFT